MPRIDLPDLDDDNPRYIKIKIPTKAPRNPFAQDAYDGKLSTKKHKDKRKEPPRYDKRNPGQ